MKYLLTIIFGIASLLYACNKKDNATPALVDDPAGLGGILRRGVGDRGALIAVGDRAGDGTGDDDRIVEAHGVSVESGTYHSPLSPITRARSSVALLCHAAVVSSSMSARRVTALILGAAGAALAGPAATAIAAHRCPVGRYDVVEQRSARWQVTAPRSKDSWDAVPRVTACNRRTGRTWKLADEDIEDDDGTYATIALRGDWLLYRKDIDDSEVSHEGGVTSNVLRGEGAAARGEERAHGRHRPHQRLRRAAALGRPRPLDAGRRARLCLRLSRRWLRSVRIRHRTQPPARRGRPRQREAGKP